MTKRLWTQREVIKILHIEQKLLEKLEEEDVICPAKKEENGERLYSATQIEHLRIVRILMEEMNVNIPGIDIILRMRQELLDMRNQFDKILEDLAVKIRQEIEK